MFMHLLLKKFRENRDHDLLVPMSQYIVSLVGCWETFLRDVFVYLLHIDAEYFAVICERVDIEIKASSEQVGSGVTYAEFVCNFFNFQSTSDIETAFGPLFHKNTFLANIGGFTVPFVSFKRGVVTPLVLNDVFEVQFIVDKALDFRHRIVHDANYRPEIHVDFIQRVESLFVLLPQIFSIWIAQKYSLRYAVFNLEDNSVEMSDITNISEKQIPYIFTIEDLLAEDWVIA